jgi:rSAM/selenodomain-associated transferase 2
MKIAVVVPILNEASTLPDLMQSLRLQSRQPDRIVIVDGGSTDGSIDVVHSLGIDSMIVPGVGRGGQIAAGVRACTEDVIVVAHADMRFPRTAFEVLQQFLKDHPDCPGGCFGHRFDNPRWTYRAIEWWDRRRAIRGHSFGDQAQFFRRESLDWVGGFPALPLMEDVELARRLRQLSVPAYLDVLVGVSARRFERLGWLRVANRNWRLRRLYRRGGEAICWELYRRYYGSTLNSLD